MCGTSIHDGHLTHTPLITAHDPQTTPFVSSKFPDAPELEWGYKPTLVLVLSVMTDTRPVLRQRPTSRWRRLGPHGLVLAMSDTVLATPC